MSPTKTNIQEFTIYLISENNDNLIARRSLPRRLLLNTFTMMHPLSTVDLIIFDLFT
uniref:Uncharacterized protein n=1 Tax=Ascaris lumbricoides TaxID=6252 RepID=A0A0M3HJI2_ASCLU